MKSNEKMGQSIFFIVLVVMFTAIAIALVGCEEKPIPDNRDKIISSLRIKLQDLETDKKKPKLAYKRLHYRTDRLQKRS